MIIFPPLLNFMILVFTWRGTNLIIAGIILNCCCAGALMRPLDVPRMKKKDLIRHLEEKQSGTIMESGSLCDTTHSTTTHPDVSAEQRHEKTVNPHPHVDSCAHVSGHLVPESNIQETQATIPPDKESSLAAAAAADSQPSTSAESGRQKPSLLEDEEPPRPPLTRVAALASGSKTTRDCSQPDMNQASSTTVPENESLPKFEKLSNTEYANTLKVVPATSKAHHSNLPTFESQEMQQMSSGHGSVSSCSIFTDADPKVLNIRPSSLRLMIKALQK